MEGPDRDSSQAMGSLFGEERAEREQIWDEALFLLLMEAAGSRRS